MAEKVTKVYTKDRGRYLSDKLRAALVSKFGEAKIGTIVVSSCGKQISIEADLTTAQWTGVKTKLDAKGFKPDEDFNFA